MKKGAIIVAGGSGTRIPSENPKQFLSLSGKPMLVYALEAFHKADPDTRIVLVLPKAFIHLWKPIHHTYLHNIPVQTTFGGETRFHSVKNGLNAIGNVDVTAIHDAARPLISPSLINRLYDAAIQHGNAIPVVKVTDSIRQLSKRSHRPVPRHQFVLIQTPQIFLNEQLIKAYHQPCSPDFTDDAMVVEAYGTAVHLEEGDPVNQKITTPADMITAEAQINRLR